MKTADTLKSSLNKTIQTLASVVKIMLMSKCPSAPSLHCEHEECVILGNGPSLTKSVEEHAGWFASKKKWGVNFMAISDAFTQLKPDFYVLADPHFFSGGTDDPKVARLWEKMSDADWRMILYVPVRFVKYAEEKTGGNRHVEVKGYNLTPIEGWGWFAAKCYKTGAGMPRPRNVLIPAIMLAIQEKFSTIYLAGADHSWSKTIWVDDDNCVVSVQPHFYPDDEKELERVRQEYKGYHLHDIFQSFAVALKSYFAIDAYARQCGVKIYNVTPGSFIDAFPRKKL